MLTQTDKVMIQCMIDKAIFKLEGKLGTADLEELLARKKACLVNESDIDYVAMMSDIDLPEHKDAAAEDNDAIKED